MLLADVRDGIGPYLGIYLLADRHWHADKIGLAMAVAGFATVAVQTPAGLLVDATRHKRLLLAGSALLIGLATVAMIWLPSLPMVVGAQVLTGVAAAVTGPALAAITLGLVGARRFDRRLGRNEAFNHAGNVAAAVLAGLLGYYLGHELIFWLVLVQGVLAVGVIRLIRPEEIDHRVARGADKDDQSNGRVASWAAVFGDRRVLVFAAAIVLFHFANAAMLPLVGQKLSADKAHGAALYMSACIVLAQLVMVPVAPVASRWAQRVGRKRVFLVAFAVLPVRGLLYTLTANPYGLVAVQVLDGVAAGIFGVVSVLMIADLTRGTGRFNLVQGAIGTATGLGAACSNLLAGAVAEHAGYNAAFGLLAAVALAALALFGWGVGETSAAAADAAPTSVAT